MYSATLKQGAKFNKVLCCVCKNNENIEVVTKEILQHGFYGYMLGF